MKDGKITERWVLRRHRAHQPLLRRHLTPTRRSTLPKGAVSGTLRAFHGDMAGTATLASLARHSIHYPWLRPLANRLTVSAPVQPALVPLRAVIAKQPEAFRQAKVAR